MRLLLFTCALAHADVTVARASLAAHALIVSNFRGPLTLRRLLRGGEFRDVRQGVVDLAPQQYELHQLIIGTDRGQFVEPFGDELINELGRQHDMVGPMTAQIDNGVLLVRGRRAIWKRDVGQLQRNTYSCKELLVACAIADGTPRCVGPMLVADESDCTEADAPGGGDWSVRDWDWRLEATVPHPGRVALRIAKGRPPHARELQGLPIVIGEVHIVP